MRSKWIKPTRYERAKLSHDYDILDGGRQWRKLRKFLQRTARAANAAYVRGIGAQANSPRVVEGVSPSGDEGRIRSYEVSNEGGPSSQAMEETSESSG